MSLVEHPWSGVRGDACSWCGVRSEALRVTIMWCLWWTDTGMVSVLGETLVWCPWYGVVSVVEL